MKNMTSLSANTQSVIVKCEQSRKALVASILNDLPLSIGDECKVAHPCKSNAYAKYLGIVRNIKVRVSPKRHDVFVTYEVSYVNPVTHIPAKRTHAITDLSTIYAVVPKVCKFAVVA